MFGDHFNYQKNEQFPSRFRKQDYSSPKFVQQQKHKMVSSLRISQLMDASLFSYDTPTKQVPSSPSALSALEQLPKIQKSQSLNAFKNKQYIVFPKVQTSIREQQQQDRNNVLLQFASTPHQNLMGNKSISSETLKMIYSQPYIHYQNVKKIRKISPETKVNHVCKRSIIIPPQQGNYAMPGLPHSDNRTKKLNNLSFTKMQWNITNYNTNFALSKKEQEIRDIIKVSDIKKILVDYGDNMLPTLQGSKTTSHQQQQQEFNFLTAYSKSPKSDINSSSIKGSPTKTNRDSNI